MTKKLLNIFISTTGTSTVLVSDKVPKQTLKLLYSFPRFDNSANGVAAIGLMINLPFLNNGVSGYENSQTLIVGSTNNLKGLVVPVYATGSLYTPPEFFCDMSDDLDGSFDCNVDVIGVNSGFKGVLLVFQYED